MPFVILSSLVGSKQVDEIFHSRKPSEKNDQRNCVELNKMKVERRERREGREVFRKESGPYFYVNLVVCT